MKPLLIFPNVNSIYLIAIICCFLITGCSEDFLAPIEPIQMQDETNLKSARSHSGNKILFLDNFEDGDSQGWYLWGTGEYDGWSIETETGNYVLSSSTGNQVAWARLQHPGWYDLRFKTRVKFISGDTYCELLFRIDDLGQHYWIQIMDNHVGLAKESGTGPFEWLASAPMNILQNTWYDFEIAARDNKIKVYVNGFPKINVKDDDPWGNIGTIGFEVHENTQVYFDDVLVTRLGGLN